jgi:SNF2 family DNA or RNA helicase
MNAMVEAPLSDITGYVTKYIPLPLTPRPYQVQAVNSIGPRQRGAYYFDPGVGKTLAATVDSLFWCRMSGYRVIVTMPPILLDQWYRWLSSIPTVKAGLYRGSPASRSAMNLDVDYLLMTMQVFKKDFQRLDRDLGGKVMLIIDEATCVANASSDNWRKAQQFISHPDRMLRLLSGTPISHPGNVFSYVKLLAPSVYRSKTQFDNIHVAERDFFGNVKKWANLDLMRDNMQVNSITILKRDVLTDLPPLSYIPVHYDLDPEHWKLYRRIADEQLVLYENGEKLDATSQQRLYQALQQVVNNWSHFSQDPTKVPASFSLVDLLLEQLDGGKLLLFANYKMTIRALLDRYAALGAVAAYSEVSPKKQRENADLFVNDPNCRLFVAHPLSAGYGLDGLQHVCSDVMFLELPYVPKDFIQAHDRLVRDGQKNAVSVHIPVANRTLQGEMYKNLLRKDSINNKVHRSYRDLKDAIYGVES